jgi:hypothetical protein
VERQSRNLNALRLFFPEQSHRSSLVSVQRIAFTSGGSGSQQPPPVATRVRQRGPLMRMLRRRAG